MLYGRARNTSKKSTSVSTRAGRLLVGICNAVARECFLRAMEHLNCCQLKLTTGVIV